MKAKLTADERHEVRTALAVIANNADVMADKLDPGRQSKVKDGERYEMARHFDAIYKLAKAAGLKLDAHE